MKLFQVGDRDDSNLYISAKMKAAAQVWIACFTDDFLLIVKIETIFQGGWGGVDVKVFAHCCPHRTDRYRCQTCAAANLGNTRRGQ